MKKVAVIGAGVAGLSCAYELKKKGFDVQVFEKEAYVGGRIKSVIKEGMALDLGAQVFTKDETHLLAYLKELQFNSFFPLPQKGVGFFFSNQLHFVHYSNLFRSFVSMHSSPSQLLRACWNILKLKWNSNGSFERDFDLSSGDQHIAQLSGLEYLSTLVDPNFADRFINSVFCGLTFQNLSEVSAAFVLNIFFPTFAPCDQGGEFASFRFKKGYQSFSERLAKELHCHTNSPVESVIADKQKIRLRRDESTP